MPNTKTKPAVIRSYRDLQVWQKAMDLAEQLYRAGTIVRGEPYHK